MSSDYEKKEHVRKAKQQAKQQRKQAKRREKRESEAEVLRHAWAKGET
jgi:hypothetical protein